MIMREFITDDEKGFRQKIYIESEAKKAKKVDGAMTIWNLLNATTDKDIVLVFKQGWAPLELCDICCNSVLIDGTHGYNNPDETEFFAIESYGQTWAAVLVGETLKEEDWNAISRIQNVLSDSNSVQNESKKDIPTNTKSKWVEVRYISTWSHKLEVCVLTSAEAPGQWKGFKYAIFYMDNKLGTHIAFHPDFEKILGTRALDVHEARKWVDALRVNCKEVMDNFHEIYGA